jgi:hypothetical protein
MNIFNKLMTGAVLAVGVLLAAGPELRAQPGPYSISPQQPNFYRPDTNVFPMTLAATTGNTNFVGATNSLQVTIRQDHGVAIEVPITVPNTTASAITGTLTLGWDVSTRGTNFTTGRPVQWAIAVSALPYSTNTYWFWTNFPNTYLNNVRKMQLTYATNTVGAAVTIGPPDYSWSGQ